jgi:hypothetical protein
MTFNPRIWYPIAVAGAAINLAGLGFAAKPLEPMHMAVHAVLALAFGLWARRLGHAPLALGDGETPVQIEGLQAQINALRQDMGEMHERLDFTERILAKGPEARRSGPQ